MTDNNDRLKYLQAAKEFTNSTNIDVLIDTARKIEDYIFQKNCDVVLPFDEFNKKNFKIWQGALGLDALKRASPR